MPTLTETVDLLGIRVERCVGFSDMEYRKADSPRGSMLLVEGYASVFDYPYPILGGPERGGFMEVVDKRAFDVTLSKNPDVPLLLNHEDVPLARTKRETLTLTTDRRGLRVRAELDRRSTRVQDLEISLERGDLDEMSFAFRTDRDAWDDDRTERRLLDVNINKGDVSIVNFGASDATSIGIRSIDDALDFLARTPAEHFTEARSERLGEVVAHLLAASKPATPRGRISVHADPRIP